MFDLSQCWGLVTSEQEAIKAHIDRASLWIYCTWKLQPTFVRVRDRSWRSVEFEFLAILNEVWILVFFELRGKVHLKIFMDGWSSEKRFLRFVLVFADFKYFFFKQNFFLFTSKFFKIKISKIKRQPEKPDKVSQNKIDGRSFTFFHEHHKFEIYSEIFHPLSLPLLLPQEIYERALVFDFLRHLIHPNALCWTMEKQRMMNVSLHSSSLVP